MKNLVAFFLALSSCFSAFAQSNFFIDYPYVETIASADTLLVPDLIYLSIEIKEKDFIKGRDFDQLDAVISNTLRGIGIDSKMQLFNSPFSSNIVVRSLTSTIIYTKSYELVIYEARQIGDVIKALEDIGDFTYGIIGTDHSQLKAIELKMSNLAASTGRNQAQGMVNAAGGNLGPVVYISDAGDSTHNLTSGAISLDSKYKAQVNDVTIKPIVVSSKVLMRFKID